MGAGLAGGALCGMIGGLLIGTLVGAVLLRAGISLFNSLAGARHDPERQVPEPDTGKAMGIVFATMLVQIGIQIALQLAGVRLEVPNPAMQPIADMLISFPVGMIVMAFMLQFMLPTTFVRGLLVSLCYMVVAIAVAAVILMIVFGVMFAAGGARL